NAAKLPWGIVLKHRLRVPVRDRRLSRVNGRCMILSMRTLGGEVARGRWRWSAVGRSPMEAFAVGSVAVLLCCVRHEAPDCREGGRPFLLGRRSGLIEAGGSLIRGAPVRVGSSPDNAGTCRYCQTVRVRLARPGCVTRVNQRPKPRNECLAQIWWIGAGVQCVTADSWWSTPKPCAGDGGEAALKVCGVGAAMLPGYS